jgi:O-antigen/teichoic acid export membrane protein
MRSQEPSSATRTIARNSAVALVAQVLIRALLIVFATYAARQLGSEQYGQYSLVSSTINLLGLPADLGLTLYCIREIARDHSKAAFLMSNAAAIRVIAAVPLALIALLAVLALGYETRIVVGVSIAGGGFFLLALQGSLDAVLVGYEKLNYSAVLNLVGQVLFMGLGALALTRYKSFTVIIVASFAGTITTTVLSYLVARMRFGKLRLSLAPRAWPGLIRAALPIALLQLFFSVALRADTFLLKHYQGNATIGWYSAAYDIVFGLFIVANAVNASLFPTVSRLSGLQPDAARSLAQQAARVLFLFSLPCAVGGGLLADRIVQMVFGVQFAPAGILLRLLLLVLPVRFLVGLADNLCIVYDRAWQAAAIAACDAALNVILNLLLIPRYGAQAAAVVGIVGESLSLGLLLWVLRDQALLTAIRKSAPAAALALAAMVVPMALLPRWNAIVLVLFAASAYAAMLLASKAVRLDEVWGIARAIVVSDRR